MFISEKDLLRRNNNFDLLRIIAAIFVYISHTYDVRGISSEEPLMQLTHHYFLFSTAGLIIFFTMSGFLVCRSLVLVRSVKQYLLNRFLRLWPAYFVCCLLTIIFIGIPFTTLPVGRFLIHRQTIYFFINSIFLIRPAQYLPGVFNDASVNASVWSIALEIKLYLVLLVLWLLKVIRFRHLVLICFLAGSIIRAFLPDEVLISSLGFSLTKFAVSVPYFFGGACFYLYKDKLPLKFSWWLIIFAIWISLLFLLPKQVHQLEAPFFIYSVLWLAFKLPKIPFPNFDLSYGFYLYAFPIQMTVQLMFGQDLTLAEYIAVTFFPILLLAAGSWFLIERKALALKHSFTFSFNKIQSPKYKTDNNEQQ